MSSRLSLPLLLVVVLLTVGGTLVAINALGFRIVSETDSLADPRRVPVTVPVLITATPDPNTTPQVIIVTATLDRTQVAVPDTVLTESAENGSTVAQRATVDPEQIGAQGLTPQVADAASASLPDNCLLHVIEENDTIFQLGLDYGVNWLLILEVNQLEENSLLNIGDEVIIPLEGCDLAELPTPPPPPSETPTPTNTPDPNVTPTVDATQTAIAELSATPENTPTPTVTPTITLAPTAVNAQIAIVEIVNPGDVTGEAVRLENRGNTVDMTNWTLTDLDGNEFVFPELLFFPQSPLTVFSGVGQDTPIALYWGLDEAVWGEPGDVLTLRDARGNVQATQRIGVSIDLD